MKRIEWLQKIKNFPQNLMGRSGVEAYFDGLKKTVESEEVKNERLAKRIELKKEEFRLKQLIQDTKLKGKKLREEYLDYDPKADARRTRRVYGMISLGMVLLFVLFKACASC